MNRLMYVLEGRPFRHPLHPLLVHLPVGLWLLMIIFDIISMASASGAWAVHAAFYSGLVGIIAALIAAVPGLVDWVEMRNDHPAQNIALTHMALNLAATALTAVSLGVRYGTWDAAATPALPFILTLVAYAMVMVSGYLGGIMIYDYGIGVGRHRRELGLPQETLFQPRAGTTEAALPGAADRVGDFIHIAPADALVEGGTLRAEINGYTVCVVKDHGQLYAFQEFCTHRYGPLSEGCVKDGRIECPWHRSQFDIATGRVVHGPAKVDLKTFPVELRDGYIAVQVPAQTMPGEQVAETAWGIRRNPPEERPREPGRPETREAREREREERP